MKQVTIRKIHPCGCAGGIRCESCRERLAGSEQEMATPAPAEIKIRFQNLDADGEEATATVEVAGQAHELERSKAWYRTGGWQYDFRCSCGWKKNSAGYHGLTNKAAVRHLHKARREGWNTDWRVLKMDVPPERRRAPRNFSTEGLCSHCGDFGPMDMNIQRCRGCAPLLREE